MGSSTMVDIISKFGLPTLIAVLSFTFLLKQMGKMEKRFIAEVDRSNEMVSDLRKAHDRELDQKDEQLAAALKLYEKERERNDRVHEYVAQLLTVTKEFSHLMGALRAMTGIEGATDVHEERVLQ